MSTTMSKASHSVILLAKASNKREKQRLRDAFKKADKDGDGKLTYDEYKEIIKMSKLNITDEEFNQIVSMKDVDEDGRISINEFLNTTNSGARKQNDLAFQLLDKNGDGCLTKEEFLQASAKLSKDQVDAVFDRNDVDGDGSLSRQEFDKLLRKK